MQDRAAVVIVAAGPGHVNDPGGVGELGEVGGPGDSAREPGGGKPRRYITDLAGRIAGHSMLWTPLAGRTILARTIDVFDTSPLIHTIVLVLAAGDIAHANALCRHEGWHKITAIVAGGATRQDSVRRGLDTLAGAASGSGWVMIHDATRPLVTPILLETGLRAAQEHQAATAAVPLKETIKQVQHGQIVATLDRSQLWAVQTPQVFSYPLIHQAHQQVAAQAQEQATDDAALLERLGQRVVVFPGSYANIKIVTAEDLLLAEALLQGSANL